MLCISNQISEFVLRQRLKETSFSLRDVYSRFDYIVCNPVVDEVQLQHIILMVCENRQTMLS